MAIFTREDKYIQLLTERDYTVRELAGKLFISEPTVRRDIIQLKKKDLVSCTHGTVRLNTKSPDKRIPLFIRDLEHTEEKRVIAQKAIAHISDGDTIMLDASTSAYCLIPYLTQFKNLLVITNGSKTAIALAALGIKTLCTGGEMTLESFSYIGPDAENMLRKYNANVAFFSCRGINEKGIASDNTIMENSLRQIMIQNSRKKYLLCDSSKFGSTYLNTTCSLKDIDGIISETALPSYLKTGKNNA
ncbi:MAG: DeoR/GlpR transcriptional regulator [Lachnospiraceae bacterium]|nr:DeoR/GlpR transcriptional regulator [Lachnospiraceae bacterium]